MQTIQIQESNRFINEMWDHSIMPVLQDYIRIPNVSPLFDPEWQSHGHMEKAVQLIASWCRKQKIENMQLDIVRLEGRTPVIFIEIPGSNEDTVLLYGHMDKQPEMTGWDTDLSPWKPVIKGDRLYGRGGADDGYSTFSSLAAISLLRAQQIPHARCVILIEACEESGSRDLPFYIEALEKRIGKPSLVICLDSGCGNYNQLWVTTSLRGLTGGVLQIEVLKEGIHSGTGSGVVPSCSLILRQLLNRIESETNGEILLKDLYVDIPPARLQQVKETARILSNDFYESYPFYKGVKPLANSTEEQLLNRTWRPALSIIGADGIPAVVHAGNVTLPSLSIKLSMRLPPTLEAEKAAALLKKTLEVNPPFNAKVHYESKEAGSGWNAPPESPWLSKAASQASKNYFDADVMYMGEGGSIPFMGMLGKKFPDAQFLITGLLGPESNAHGPNEFLHIPTAKKLSCCIAEIIAQQYASL